LNQKEKVEINDCFSLWFLSNQILSSFRLEYPYFLVTFDQLLSDPLSFFLKSKIKLDLEFLYDLKSKFLNLLNLTNLSKKKFNCGSAIKNDIVNFDRYSFIYFEFCKMTIEIEFKEKFKSLTIELEMMSKQISDLKNEVFLLEKSKNEKEKIVKNNLSEIEHLKNCLNEKIKESEVLKNVILCLKKDGKEKPKTSLDNQILHKNFVNFYVKEKDIDAGFDDFINDLKPFFYPRFITFVDIGAFVGNVFLKILNSKDLKIREAHLYEPNPESYRQLKENISHCNIPDLHAYNFAVSDKNEILQFKSAKSMSKNINIKLNTESVSNTFKAKCYRLDELSEAYTDNRIDLLKIDVEGKEIDVLNSSSKLLKQNLIDVIYLEAGLNKESTQQTYLNDIDLFLQDYGYRIFKIYEQKFEWIQNIPFLRRCNVAYMSYRFANSNPLNITLENFILKQELEKLKKPQ